MAVLSANQCVKVWSDGGMTDRTCLYAIRNGDTGDTTDLAADFTVVKRGVVLGTTVAGAASATIAGTVATLPAGMTDDAAWLLVWGCAG